MVVNDSVARMMSPTRLFLTAAVISSLLWIHAVLTTSIVRIEYSSVPIVSMFRLMPATFWVGWAFLTVATVIWYFSPGTRPLHLLLVILWFLFLFIGPESMQVYRRGADTLGHMRGVTLYDNDMYRAPWVGYSAFPGFHFFAIPLDKVTSVGFFELGKLVGLALHLVRIPAIWFLASRLFKERKQALFFTLLVTALFWEKFVFDPSNQNMALTFVFLVLAFFFQPGTWTAPQRILVILLYLGAVVTHPLSAFLLAVLLLFLSSIAGLARRDIGLNEDVKRGNFIALFFVMFTAWLMYSSDWVLPSALDFFTRLFIEQDRSAALGTTGSVTNSSGTVTTSLLAALIWGFLGLLLLWGLAIVSRREFWRQLNLKRVLPLLCFVPLLASLATGFWTLDRYYIFAVPFMAWFFTQHLEMRRYLAIVILIAFFPYAFTLRYYNESLDYPPSSEYIASQFIVEEISLQATVVQGIRYGPGFKALANAVEGPERGDFINVSEAELTPGRDFRYAYYSSWNRDHTIFYLGEELWNKANVYLFEVPSNKIYSNGDGQIHYYEAD